MATQRELAVATAGHAVMHRIISASYDNLGGASGVLRQFILHKNPW
jgi:hypothetical protein